MSLQKISEASIYLLNNYPNAQEYKDYLKGRLSEESISKWEFGFLPSMKEMSSLTSILDEELLVKENIILQRQIEDSSSFHINKSSYFENYPIILPFKDVYGNIIAFVARTILPEKTRKIPKYKNSQFKKSNHVFGLFENKAEIIKQNFCYVVEGQFDVIKANEKGLNNIVAIGSSNMSAFQLALISRYTDNIFILFDNDDAGLKGRDYIKKKFQDFVNIRNFFLPPAYNDIDDFFQENELKDLELTTQ